MADDTGSGGSMTDPSGVSMVLYARRPVCGARTETLNRLTGLHSGDDIDDFEVETWPNEVVLDDKDGHATLVTTFRMFEEWAAERGVSVRPPFEVRTAGSLVGNSQEVLVLPALCLAVYDESLAGVFPCTDGTTTWTVPEYLDAYEAAEDRPPGIDDLRDAARTA